MMVSAEQLSAFRSCVDDILCSLGKFLADLTDAPSQEVGDAQASMDEQLQHFFKVYYALRKRHDDASLSAAILALTKSGKSTLLNAIMGRECLPMNNVPETARLCKIEHSLEAQPRMLERDVEYRGDSDIRRRLQEINSEVRAREYHPSDEQMLHIFTPVAVFDGHHESGTKFFLLDTPGPNEAGEEGLRFQVERLLDSVDAVIYLLDYTKLKTAEEAAIFTRLKQINPLLVRRLSQRLFFVVNKSDQLHESEGLDEQDTKEYVAQLVTQQLAFEGFQLTPDQVILLSARNALSARLVLAGQPPSERFYRQAFGARWQRRLSSLSPADVEGAAEELLAESGIRELEERVLGFLYNHSASLKLLAVVDDMARLLQEVWNVTESCRAALDKNVSELRRQTKDMRSQLQSTLQDFESTMHMAETLQGQVTDEIRQHLDNLRTKLFNYIMQTLEPEIQGAATPIAGRPQPSRWKSIRDKFLGLFGGGGRSASRSKDELASLLIELHEDLLAQISSEVSEFWHVLEGCTSLRHAQLISSINIELKTLSSRVEHIVSETLDVELEAVHIGLQMPSAEQFHSDLQELITRGIAEKTERHIRVGQRKYEERVMRFRQGLCRLGTYWENVPRTRTVVETYNVTVFQVQPSEILNHFIHMVDSAVDNTSAVLHNYVRQFMYDQLTQARNKIQAYADRYLKAMSSALNSSSAGEASRQQALSQVASRLSQVEELRGAISELQGKVESVVPQHDYEEVDFDVYEMLLEQQREEERKAVEAAKLAMAAAGLDTKSVQIAGTSGPMPSTDIPTHSVYETLLKEAGMVALETERSTTISSEAASIEAELPVVGEREDASREVRAEAVSQPAPVLPQKGVVSAHSSISNLQVLPIDSAPEPMPVSGTAVSEPSSLVRAGELDSLGAATDSTSLGAGEPNSLGAQEPNVDQGSTEVVQEGLSMGDSVAQPDLDPVSTVLSDSEHATGGIKVEVEPVPVDGDSAMTQAGSASDRDVPFDDVDSVVLVSVSEGGDASEAEQAGLIPALGAVTEPDAAGCNLTSKVEESAVPAEPEAAEEGTVESPGDAAAAAEAVGKEEEENEEEDGLLFVDNLQEEAAQQLAQVGGHADELVTNFGSEFESPSSHLSGQQLGDEIPTFGSDGERGSILLQAASRSGEQVSEPTTSVPSRPVVEVAAEYANITPASSPTSPPHITTNTSTAPPDSPSPPQTPEREPQSTIPTLVSSIGLPVVHAAGVAGDNDGYKTCSEEDTDYDSVHRDDVPFDYQRGFFAAMSTSHVAPPMSPGSHCSEDGWEVVDDAHVDTKGGN